MATSDSGFLFLSDSPLSKVARPRRPFGFLSTKLSRTMWGPKQDEQSSSRRRRASKRCLEASVESTRFHLGCQDTMQATQAHFFLFLSGSYTLHAQCNTVRKQFRLRQPQNQPSRIKMNRVLNVLVLCLIWLGLRKAGKIRNVKGYSAGGLQASRGLKNQADASMFLLVSGASRPPALVIDADSEKHSFEHPCSGDDTRPTC